MTTRIVKVGPNNVEVTPTRVAIDIDGNEIEIYDESRTKSYGAKAIAELQPVYEKELTDANALDARQYKTDLIARYQVELDKLTQLKNILPQEEATDAAGNPVQIFKRGSSEAYDELIETMRNTKQRIAEAEALDPAQYKNDLVASAQAKVDEMNAIIAEMASS